MNSVNYFNSIAKEWNRIRVEYFKDELRERAINSVDINNKVIADLGAGTGFISLEIAKKANIVFSVDSSKNMLGELYRAAKDSNLNNIYPINGEVEDLPLFDDSIDLVFMNMALHHVENPDKAIKEIYRILKQGGKVIITDVLEHNGQWAREEMFDVWLGFNYDQLINWFEEAYFKNIYVSNTGLVARGESSLGEVIEPGIFMVIAKK
ncbi:methyltransferase domain-containing protein [Clostridium perfringens]|nr:methyltransferase domain-containing protein [Clostridium perfringens]